MISLPDFLEVVLKALALFGMSSAAGGVVFCLSVLRPLDSPALRDAQGLKMSLILIACGGVLAAVADVTGLLIAPWALADETGRWSLSELLGSQFANASLRHSGMGLSLGASAIWIFRRPDSWSGWLVMTLAMLAFMVSGAWLTHAAGHLENVTPLMTATVIHQFGASAWGGGLLHLAFSRLRLRRTAEGQCLWPAVVARFSLLAVFSVVIILATALYLSFHYIGDFSGLTGTTYGAITLSKAALASLALCLGAINFLTVRSWVLNTKLSGISTRTPALILVELWIVLVII